MTRTVVGAVILAGWIGMAQAQPAPTNTSRPTATKTVTALPTATERATLVPSNTPTPTHTPLAKCLGAGAVTIGATGEQAAQVGLNATSASTVINVPTGGADIIAVASFTGQGAAGMGSPSYGYWQLRLDGSTTVASPTRTGYIKDSQSTQPISIVHRFASVAAGAHTVALYHGANPGPITTANVDLTAFPLRTYDTTKVVPAASTVSTGPSATDSDTPTTLLSTTITTATIATPLLVSATLDTKTGLGSGDPHTAAFDLQVDGETVGCPILLQMGVGSDLQSVALYGLSTSLQPGEHTITLRHSTSSNLTPIVSDNASLVVLQPSQATMVLPSVEDQTCNGVSTTSTSLAAVAGSSASLPFPSSAAKGAVFVGASYTNLSSGTGGVRTASNKLYVDTAATSQLMSRTLPGTTDSTAGMVSTLKRVTTDGPHTLAVYHNTSSASAAIKTDDTTLVGLSLCANPSATPDAAYTATPTHVPTSTPVATSTAVATATKTNTPTATSTPTATPTVTPTSYVVAGHPVLDTGIPTLSSCGTNPSGIGNDAVFRLTIGTGTVTACTVTFSHAWPVAPICLVEDATDGTVVRVSASSTAAITITAAADMAGDVILGHCFGIYGDGVSWP